MVRGRQTFLQTNQLFQIAARFALISCKVAHIGLDIGWTIFVACGKIRDKRMTDFVVDTADEHEQESSMILVIEIVLILALICTDCCVKQMLKAPRVSI